MTASWSICCDVFLCSLRKLLHPGILFVKLVLSEEMDFCYARQAFRRDFHVFIYINFLERQVKCHLLDI